MIQHRNRNRGELRGEGLEEIFQIEKSKRRVGEETGKRLELAYRTFGDTVPAGSGGGKGVRKEDAQNRNLKKKVFGKMKGRGQSCKWSTIPRDQSQGVAERSVLKRRRTGEPVACGEFTW